MKAMPIGRISNTTEPSHELCFSSVYHPGRRVVVPCDEAGHVDMDALSDRLRTAYLGARAMIGREYLYPTVQRTH